MKKEILPISIEVETSAPTKAGTQQSFLHVKFKVAEGGAGQIGTLKLEYDLEFAAKVEEAMQTQRALTLTIE